MPGSYARLTIHVVFSTRDRLPHIAPELKRTLYPYMGGIVREIGGRALIVNGTADHVHLLLSLPARISIAEAMRVLKANSSRWVKLTYPERSDFWWQNGYGAFSVGPADLERVRSYIARQEAHHREVSYQDEFLDLLQTHGIEYEERYLWD